MKKSASIIPVSSPSCQVISWKFYLKSAFSSSKDLLNYLEIAEPSKSKTVCESPEFPVRVPLPFAQKMEKGNLSDPLLRQVLALEKEKVFVPGYSKDPLRETSTSNVRLLHKYKGRVLLLVSSACAINCRYCFRRHFPYENYTININELEHTLDYIRKDKSITEVILSGGDPLLTSDRQLERLLGKITHINHVKRLRIHTRLPVVIPQRITTSLIAMLAKIRLQTTLVLHINHANEIDSLLGNLIKKLVNSGTLVFNQSVLLSGVNDDFRTLADLSEKMYGYKIIPYYIHLLDPVAGAAHFNVEQKKAVKIMQELSNILPGYLVPKLAVEEVFKQSKTVLV